MKKVMKWILGILLGLFLLGIFLPDPPKKEKSTPNKIIAQVKEPEKPVEVPESELTSKERFAKAKKLLGEDDTRWDGWRYLNTIKEDDKEYPEAKKLRSQVEAKKLRSQAEAKKLRRPEEARQETRVKKEQAEEEKRTASARKEYAESLEYDLLNNSRMDTTITTSGKNNTTIKIKYILVSRVFVNELTKKEEFINNLRRLGFNKLVFTDGYHGDWITTIPPW